MSSKQSHIHFSIFVGLLFCLLSFALSAQASQNSTVNEKKITLIFKGLNESEYLEFRTYLSLYSGFAAMSLTQKSPSQSVLEYHTSSRLDMLENNLRKTSKQLGLQTYLDIQRNQITVQVISRNVKNDLKFREW